MKKLSPYLIALVVVLIAGLFSFPAFATGPKAATWTCTGDGTISNIWCSLSNEFRFIPKTLVVMAYGAGIILTMLGLLGLKKYGDDPSQTPLRDVVMKFVLAAFLIMLPYAMQVVVGSVTGKGLGNQNAIDTKVGRPCAARRSTINGGAVPGC